MRWLQAVVTALSILATTGCPSEFGKDGRIAKAIHKDTQEQLIIIRCADEVRERVCARGKENSDECLRCGGP